MKKRISLIIFLALLLAEVSLPQSFGVMTFNLRYDNPGDGPDRWTYRKEEVVSLIQRYHPAFIGIQEGLSHQVIYLDSTLTNYTYTGVGRDDGQTAGEYSAIFYDTTRFQLTSGSTFWLSPTPDTISKGWDAALERICTWGHFTSRDGKVTLFVFNTHFDHIGTEARKNSALLILRKINEITKGTNDPVILTGDFNAPPESPPIQILSHGLTEAARRSPDGISGPEGTFTGFQTTTPPQQRIDYIFIRGLQVTKYIHIIDKRKNGRRISDHLPVFTKVYL